jgi:hypothetical protein
MNDKKHIEDILYYFEKYHYENMILDDDEAKFIHDYIINLQSKIDKAIEYIENHTDKLKTTRIPKIDFNYNELLDGLKGEDNE